MPGLSNRKIRKLFLGKLSDADVEALRFDWPVWSRLKQRPPISDWRTWLVLGGRGAGKTRTGAEWLKGIALADPHFKGDAAGRIALVGQSYDDARDVMVEGESGILAIHKRADRPLWLSSRRELIWPNGTVGKIFSSSDPEGLRGSQFGAAWCDVFFDPKSDQSALPRFSAGIRDDLIQRRFLQAHFEYWNETENNPVSNIYGGRMVPTELIAPWAWDARPYPWFPLNLDSWSDGVNWHRGHWLNGRLGGCALDDLIREILADNDFDVEKVRLNLDGLVDGYVVPAQSSVRQTLEPLLALFDAFATEEGGEFVFSQSEHSDIRLVSNEHLVLEDGNTMKSVKRQAELDLPAETMIAHSSVFGDYEQTSTKSRRLNGGSDRQISIQVPAVVQEDMAINLANMRLRDDWHGRQSCDISLPTSMLAISPGDKVKFQDDDEASEWLVVSSENGVFQKLHLRATFDNQQVGGTYNEDFPPLTEGAEYGPPLVHMMDLPALDENDLEATLTYTATYAEPWAGEYHYLRSPSETSYKLVQTVDKRATIGVLVSDLLSGEPGRIDGKNTIHLSLFNGFLQSRPLLDVLSGENVLAIKSVSGGYEIVQFLNAQMQNDGTWILSNLLRGQLGTESEMRSGALAGSEVVLLDEQITPMRLTTGDLGLSYNWRIGPASYPVTSEAYASFAHTISGRNQQMLSPVHLKEVRMVDETQFSWIRRSRKNADSWEAAEVPMDVDEERYLIRIRDEQENVLRETSTSEPKFSYSDAARAEDFGNLSEQIVLEVSQLNNSGLPGTASRFVSS